MFAISMVGTLQATLVLIYFYNLIKDASWGGSLSRPREMFA
jgi:hypothetical protein